MFPLIGESSALRVLSRYSFSVVVVVEEKSTCHNSLHGRERRKKQRREKRDKRERRGREQTARYILSLLAKLIKLPLTYFLVVVVHLKNARKKKGGQYVNTRKREVVTQHIIIKIIKYMCGRIKKKILLLQK